MRRLLALSMIAFAANLAACVSYQKPLVDEATTPERTKDLAASWGLLGITGTFALDNLTLQAPEISLTAKNVASGETRLLRIDRTDMKAFATGSGPKAIIFPMPPGKYELIASEMNAPGGIIGGREFSDMTQKLGIERYVQPFEIKADKLTHLANVKFSLKDTRTGNKRFFYFETTTDPSKPPVAPWRKWDRRLSGATYLKRTSKGFMWRPMALKDSGGDAVDADGKVKTLSPSAVQSVTKTVDKGVRDCHKAHFKKFKGKLEIKYVINPDGKAEEIKVSAPPQTPAPMQTCIVNLYEALQFPATPSEDFESWTSSWEF